MRVRYRRACCSAHSSACATVSVAVFSLGHGVDGVSGELERYCWYSAHFGLLPTQVLLCLRRLVRRWHVVVSQCSVDLLARKVLAVRGRVEHRLLHPHVELQDVVVSVAHAPRFGYDTHAVDDVVVVFEVHR